MPDQKADTVARLIFENHIKEHGVTFSGELLTCYVTTSCFKIAHRTGETVWEWVNANIMLEICNSQIENKPPLSPQADGLIERFNRILKQLGRYIAADGKESWTTIPSNWNLPVIRRDIVVPANLPFFLDGRRLEALPPCGY